MGHPKEGNETLGRYFWGYSIAEAKPNSENPRDAIATQGDEGWSSQLWLRRVRILLISGRGQTQFAGRR